MSRYIVALCAAFVVAGCSSSAPEQDHEAVETHEEGVVTLTAEQIALAGIKLARPSTGGGGAIEAPALLEADPQAMRVVAATVPGRVVELRPNLGDTVRRGETLAVLESREAAALRADIEQARTRAALAHSTLNRDEALYGQGFRPLREVEISRAAAAQADTAVRLARQQLAASGAGGGNLNRIAITAPISGQIIARKAVLGQTFATDAADPELLRVAQLDRLSVVLSLPPADAARVGVGDAVEVTAGGRSQEAKLRFVSPVLDEQTRLVRVMAVLDNASGQWRAGEPVTARVRLAVPTGQKGVLTIPTEAVQIVGGRQTVFVRTATGFRAVPVTLGQGSGSMVAVVAGLSGKEEIAVVNSFTLKAELGKGEAGHED
ncbi:MAG: efflux RND transporter periplasmic adaptor subunit [Sphingobium sp.]|nr:efflux RND transporter periplasmic adaptor subunit [Sphingobium sp.]